MNRFDLCIKRVLVHEGGKVHDPVDRGGRTNRGVTQRVYDDYRRSRGHPSIDVWDMSDAECKDVYFARYWAPLQCGVLPVGLDYVVFDAGVNIGISRSAKWLQTALGLSAGEVDGVIARPAGA
jgi:lysozyme family protein